MNSDRYAAAERLLPHRWTELVRGGVVQPSFVPGSDRFWYRSTASDRMRYLLVDPDRRDVRELFDHDRLAAALSSLLGTPYDAGALPLEHVSVADGRLTLGVAGQRVELSTTSYACRVLGPAPAKHESVSPDEHWAVRVRDHDLVLRDLANGRERRLTRDGGPLRPWAAAPSVVRRQAFLDDVGLQAPPLVRWAPDSSRLFTLRLDESQLGTMHLIRAAPRNGGPPQDHAYPYALLGDDELPTAQLVVLDVASGTSVVLDGGPYLVPWTTPVSKGFSWWSPDSTQVFFLDANRDETTLRLVMADASTGRVRTVISECDSSRVSPGPDLYPQPIRALRSGEILWWSERSGFGHLYLYDARGRELRVLTEGPWVVRRVIAVDEDARTVVFAAGGRERGSDPYARQLYRVHLDSAELVRLTDDPLDHEAVGSPTGHYVVDVASSLDTPARSTVLSAAGDVVLKLEFGDATALTAAGYRPAEPFVVKAADGVTELHGVLYPPADLDPSRRYPVLDDIYPGPAFAPKPVRYPGSAGGMAGADQPALAALGFAVITLNNRGTPLWSKAFRDHTRGDDYDDLLADHVAALRQLGGRHSWLDLTRVGIYGTSGGGHASTRAMLVYPEVFHAAVSAAGSHDERCYHAMWGERFVGSLAGTDYAAKANSSLAQQLVGKLMLVHGDMDDNVTPYLTLQLVDALHRAGKDIELLLLPNADHGLQHHRHHWWRRRWDFFVRHLMDEQPPPHRLASVPLDVEGVLATLG